MHSLEIQVSDLRQRYFLSKFDLIPSQMQSIDARWKSLSERTQTIVADPVVT